ncbi:polysaccharide deacetylase family protein [Tumebacillus permanentifrigoris]|nr:polysaccharide deacetylase family protein [Tumebacillus permanentifrigoris]
MKRASQRRKFGLLLGVLVVLVLAVFTVLYQRSTSEAVTMVKYIPEPRVPILMYHSISPGTDLRVSPEDFDAQMKWLQEHGYKPITLGQLGRHWDGTYDVTGGKPLVITFDDGYLDNYTAAWPILQKYHFPATIFVITDSIKLDNHMKWGQMQEMHAGGVEFGSHMVYHSNFTLTPQDQIASELQASKKTLEQGLSSPVTTFCYPGGGLIPEAAGLVRQAGYTMAVTTHHGLASAVEDHVLLSRVRVVGGVTIEEFANMLQTL